MLALDEAGVMAKRTIRAFDEMCLTPVEGIAPEEIRELRMCENMSQAVFARYLNVTTSLINQAGAGRFLKLLALIARNGLNAVA